MTLNNGTATSHGPTAGAARMPSYAGTLAATCGAAFVAQDANALPTSLNGLFQQDLHTHGSQLTRITAAFMMAVVCFKSTFGALGDLFGRRRLVLAGTALVAVDSTVATLATTVQVLWLGAALNSQGAGAMFPVRSPHSPRSPATYGSGHTPSPSGAGSCPPAPPFPPCSAACSPRSGRGAAPSGCSSDSP